MDEVVALERDLFVHVRRKARVIFRRTDAVDARDRSDDDHIATRKQRCRRLVTQHLDLLVNRRILLDVGVALRYVRLGLVIVVIRDEVDDGVIGKKLLELARQLGGKRFIGSHDKRWLAERLDGLGHRERLAGTGDAEEDLIAVTILHALHEFLDRLGLIPRRFVRRDHLELGIAVSVPKTLQLATDTLDLKLSHICSSQSRLSIGEERCRETT